MQALILSYKLDSLDDGLLAWSLEFEVVAIAEEGLQLLVHSVVADANDRRLGLLDDLYKGLNTPAVSGPQTVNLIHNNYRLLSIVCLLHVVMHGSVLIVGLHPLETSHREIIE